MNMRLCYLLLLSFALTPAYAFDLEQQLKEALKQGAVQPQDVVKLFSGTSQDEERSPLGARLRAIYSALRRW